MVLSGGENTMCHFFLFSSPRFCGNFHKELFLNYVNRLPKWKVAAFTLSFLFRGCTVAPLVAVQNASGGLELNPLIPRIY